MGAGGCLQRKRKPSICTSPIFSSGEMGPWLDLTRRVLLVASSLRTWPGTRPPLSLRIIQIRRTCSQSIITRRTTVSVRKAYTGPNSNSITMILRVLITHTHLSVSLEKLGNWLRLGQLIRSHNCCPKSMIIDASTAMEGPLPLRENMLGLSVACRYSLPSLPSLLQRKLVHGCSAIVSYQGPGERTNILSLPVVSCLVLL